MLDNIQSPLSVRFAVTPATVAEMTPKGLTSSLSDVRVSPPGPQSDSLSALLALVAGPSPQLLSSPLMLNYNIQVNMQAQLCIDKILRCVLTFNSKLMRQMSTIYRY